MISSFSFLLFSLYSVVIVCETATDNRDYGNYEYKLRHALYGIKKPIDYEHRPSLYSNQSTYVELGVSIISVDDFNAATHILTANVWIRLLWYDFSFYWKEEEYGGINVLRIPSQYIWLPDILLENNAEASQSNLGHFRSNVLAYPNGHILWVPSSKYSISCAANLHKFPFDSHICTLTFRSWSIEGKNLKIQPYGNQKNIDLSDYWAHKEWEVKDAKETIVNEETDQDVAISFAVSLERRSYYYVLTCVIPILLSWFLMLVLFWLPLSNPRIFLSSLTVVYLQILILQLRRIIPNNGNIVPVIVVISGQSIIFAAFLLVFSVVLKAMSKTEVPPRLPIRFKTILERWFSYMLCVQPKNITDVNSGVQLLNNSNVELNIDKVDQNEVYCNWLLLIKVLNRFMFVIYLLSFFTIFLITVLIS